MNIYIKLFEKFVRVYDSFFFFFNADDWTFIADVKRVSLYFVYSVWFLFSSRNFFFSVKFCCGHRNWPIEWHFQWKFFRRWWYEYLLSVETLLQCLSRLYFYKLFCEKLLGLVWGTLLSGLSENNRAKCLTQFLLPNWLWVFMYNLGE